MTGDFRHGLGHTLGETAVPRSLLVGLLVVIGPAFGLPGLPSPALPELTGAAGVLGGWLGNSDRSAESLRE
jgi:hypothetical protein